MNRLSFPLSANKINIISVNLYRSSPSAVTDDIGIVRYSRALHCIAEHCIVWRGIAWYQMVLYGAAWHCTGFHHHAPPCLAPPCPSCTIFHDFAPCCTRLHRIPWHYHLLSLTHLVIINWAHRNYHHHGTFVFIIVGFYSHHYQLIFIGIHHHLHQIDCL